MKTQMKATALLGALLLAAFAARGAATEYTGGEALWWMTPAPGEITVTVDIGGGNTELKSASELGANAARVRATSADGTTAYLNIVYQNEQGVWLIDNDQPWSSVVDTPVKGVWADISDYGSASWSFAIELGNWSATETDASWTMVAESQSATYEDLKSKYIDKPGLSLPGHVAWNPPVYTAVPEPSSGLLMLIGGALMALRRRRRA